MTARNDPIAFAPPVDRFHLPPVEPVVIGMPELCRTGLSENWLWKACGHRHWLALAGAHGLEKPEFRNEDGARLYPAFTALHMTDVHLDAVREHEGITFDVSLTRTGRTRFASAITVRNRTGTVAQVRLDSVFVGRDVPGRNRSARRGIVARPCRLLPPSVGQAPLRASDWSEIDGFLSADRREIASMVIDPSPHEEFNGADFLYFASYQLLVDRAEWHWFRRRDPILSTSSRRILLMGNIEIGDRIRAVLCGSDEGEGMLSTWMELRRESDDTVIAMAFTRRIACRRPHSA